MQSDNKETKANPLGNLIEVGKDKLITLSAGALITIVTFVASMSGDWREVQSRVHANEIRVSNHEQEMRAAILRIENKIEELNKNVSEVKGYLKGKGE